MSSSRCKSSKFIAKGISLHVPYQITSEVIHVGYDRMFTGNHVAVCAYPLDQIMAGRGRQADVVEYKTYNWPEAVVSYNTDTGALVLKLANILHMSYAITDRSSDPKYTDCAPKHTIPPFSKVIYHKFCNSYLVYNGKVILGADADLKSLTKLDYKRVPCGIHVVASEYSDHLFMLSVNDTDITMIDSSGMTNRIPLCTVDIPTCIAYRPGSPDLLTCSSNQAILSVDPWNSSRSGHQQLRIGARWTYLKHADNNICVLKNSNEISVVDLRYGRARTISARSCYGDTVWCAIVNGRLVVFSRDIGEWHAYM